VAENLVRCAVDGVPDVLIAGNVEVVMLLISVVDIASRLLVVLFVVVENCVVIAVFVVALMRQRRQP